MTAIDVFGPAPDLPHEAIAEIESERTLFPEDFMFPICGSKLAAAKAVIKKHHYTHSVPSGKSYYFYWRGVVVTFSIPANKNLGRFLLGRECKCWELARLWARDGHRKNALTEALAHAIRGFKRVEPACELLVSFADPNAGHEGCVYRAASWIYTGVSTETRAYEDAHGQRVSRRKFHSGSKKSLTRAEIERLGYRQIAVRGKHRFAKGLTRQARKDLKALHDTVTASQEHP